MAFITIADYNVVIGEAQMKVLSQATDTNLDNAQAEAQEEISSYLRPKYDCDSIFSQEGEKWNKLIVMFTCDIALYHLIAAMPQRMGSEVRKERYERAVKWLEGVQSGKIVPELPVKTDSDGNPSGSDFIVSSEEKQHYNW